MIRTERLVDYLKNYYLAVDIGASSGRHILGYLDNGRIRLEEIYRFENAMKTVNGSLCWDTSRLFSEKIGRAHV